MPFKCPLCSKVSYSINDEINGYCGNCYLFVDDPAMGSGAMLTKISPEERTDKKDEEK